VRGKPWGLTDWKEMKLYNHPRDNNLILTSKEHDELWAVLMKGEYKFADAENAQE